MTTPLAARLLDRIRDEGPIGFDAYMDAALYDPEHGFYTRGGRGPGPDFVTSPEISPLFGATLARAVAACHRVLGGPVPFTLCEVGAGGGRLMADLLTAAADSGDDWLGALEVILVDPRPVTAAEQGFLRARVLSDVQPFEGVLLANELLDNLPVRLLAPAGEVRVSERDGYLALVPDISDISDVTVDPVGIRAFIGQLSRVLVRGVAILVDYGARADLSVRTFGRHGLGEDPLEDPGERDLTVSVDWDGVIAEAGRHDLALLGRQRQREVLLGLGLRTALDYLRDAELAALHRQDVWHGLRLRDQRTRAAALLDPLGPGGFDVVVLGRDVPVALPWEPGGHPRAYP